MDVAAGGVISNYSRILHFGRSQDVDREPDDYNGESVSKLGTRVDPSSIPKSQVSCWSRLNSLATPRATQEKGAMAIIKLMYDLAGAVQN